MNHKFQEHKVSSQTKILILGTFHPNVENEADFFYGRNRNYLWRILPKCFDQEDLKFSNKEEKLNFMSEFKVDFADIVSSLNDIPLGQEKNYDDKFVDSFVGDWHETFELIDSLKNLEAVYFTRKTFYGIPNIEERISQIRNHCSQKCLRFCLLETPARFCNDRKMEAWKKTIIEKTTCL